MKRLMSTVAVVLTAGICAYAQQAGPSEQKPAPSIAGKWNLSVDTPNGTLPSELNVKLDGRKVSGTLASQMGETPIAGEFADGKLSFSLSFQGASGAGQVIFVGSLKNDGTFAGTMDFSGQGLNLPWKAERAAAAEAAPQDAPKKNDAPKAADVVGKWAMSFEIQAMGMTATPALVFKQDGDKITGTYTGRYGTFPFTATVKERHVEFSFKMDTDAGQTTMSFAGDIAADGQTMKGTGSIEGLGDVTWTAKRDKS